VAAPGPVEARSGGSSGLAGWGAVALSEAADVAARQAGAALLPEAVVRVVGGVERRVGAAGWW
jgi:hypothetical protein